MTKPDGYGQSVQLLVYLLDFIQSMNSQYACIGAFAGAYHGSVRASLDVDIILFSPSKPEDFCEQFNNWNKKQDLELIYNQADLFDPINGLIRITDSFENRVDILLGIKGVSKNILERLNEIEIFGSKLKIVGLEDYIAMKIFAGSNIDIQDAELAFKANITNLNLELLNNLVSVYSLDEKEILNKIVKKCT